ncbi:hypothetical protein ACFQFQ_07695 [Sulfitobacter porphyrae]|uniref:Uncharacterized protein n=1 Tax=Sulfitobacter porphyrae TaxID=1246864 RepID=A0ABW2B2N8_9RHOB
MIGTRDLLHALDLQRRLDAPLGEILIYQGLATQDEVLDALCAQCRAHRVDLAVDPPDPTLTEALPAALCLRFRVVPWMRVGAFCWSRPAIRPILTGYGPA